MDSGKQSQSLITESTNEDPKHVHESDTKARVCLCIHFTGLLRKPSFLANHKP